MFINFIPIYTYIQKPSEILIKLAMEKSMYGYLANDFRYKAE